jgi:hypothetical protein
MISIISLFDVNIYPKKNLESRKNKNNLVQTAEEMGSTGRRIFNMVARPNVPMSQDKIKRNMRLAVASLHGAGTLTKQASSKIGPLTVKKKSYVGPERRKSYKPNIPSMRKAA